MPTQLKNIDINEPIYNDGAGDLKLGLNIFFLRELYINSFKRNNYFSLENRRDWWTEINDLFIQDLTLHYQNIIEIYSNIFMGKIGGIKFKEGYKGKLWDKIRIGDKVSTLFKENKNAEFIELCEGYLYFVYPDSTFTLRVRVGDDDLDYVETDEELMNYDIQEFFIYDDSLSLSVGEFDFPESWKNSSPYNIGV